MNKERFLIMALLVMMCIGVTIACEPTPPPTPEPNYTECNTTIPITNTNNNTNNNDLSNNQTQDQNQNQNQSQNQDQDQIQDQTQNTTVIVDNQNDNQNNQSNTLDIIFNPIINIFNYFNATNTANPTFTNNPVITLQSSNGQLLDIALDQETVQYAYNQQGQYQIIPKQIPFPAVLCKGAITPYGKVLGVQEHNATISGENEPVTGYPIGGIMSGIALCLLGLIAAAKSGLLARLGL